MTLPSSFSWVGTENAPSKRIPMGTRDSSQNPRWNPATFRKAPGRTPRYPAAAREIPAYCGAPWTPRPKGHCDCLSIFSPLIFSAALLRLSCSTTTSAVIFCFLPRCCNPREERLLVGGGVSYVGNIIYLVVRLFAVLFRARYRYAAPVYIFLSAQQYFTSLDFNVIVAVGFICSNRSMLL